MTRVGSSHTSFFNGLGESTFEDFAIPVAGVVTPPGFNTTTATMGCA
jgi:hypothetical protein